jgi:hypothetical protein
MNLQQNLARLPLGTLVWAIAGILFGGMFASAKEAFAVILDASPLALPIACALAGMITAAFFGALRAASLGVMTGVLSGLGYLAFADISTNPLPFLAGAALFAILLSAVMPEELSIIHPLGQAISGLFAGFGAGLMMLLLNNALPDLSPAWQGAAAVAGVGLLYMIISPFVLKLCTDRLSRVGTPVISAIVAATTSATIWLVIRTDPAIDGSMASPAYAHVFANVPASAFGAMIGGALGGAIFSLLGIRAGEYTV